MPGAAVSQRQSGRLTAGATIDGATLKRILIVTDAWSPQVNGVVRTIGNTCAQLTALGHEVHLITPAMFRTVPCPGYAEIRLSLPTAGQIMRRIDAINPDALHIATEGPLGWFARHCALKRNWQFTTAYHTRFPEYIKARTGIALQMSYRLLARFHRPAHAVLAPTVSMVRLLREQQFGNVVHWGRGVDHSVFYPRIARQQSQRHTGPVFLYAGRISVEKNLDAFLSLDLPGQKWVAGHGPLESAMRRKYGQVRFLGVLDQNRLAQVYSQADVFVFPSRTDTFGLVMVEAMACGLPVAAFPVVGPVDVIGQSQAGVLDEDLRQACLACLDLPRQAALEQASRFTWARATRQFLAALVPMRALSES